jgi:hypothetical protein
VIPQRRIDNGAATNDSFIRERLDFVEFATLESVSEPTRVSNPSGVLKYHLVIVKVNQASCNHHRHSADDVIFADGPCTIAFLDYNSLELVLADVLNLIDLDGLDLVLAHIFLLENKKGHLRDPLQGANGKW